MDQILFFNEDIKYELPSVKKTTNWLLMIAQAENHTIEDLNYIFCSDEHLLSINQEFLNHDYYTDIITFDNSDEPHIIKADIFISIDRVNENATTNKVSLVEELNRVMAHGLLHLLGYNDKTPTEQKAMRQKEDSCLSLFPK
ncbi:MAG: rRNA maturation RNase YbeY [Cyclobacteriaceae bacterium]